MMIRFLSGFFFFFFNDTATTEIYTLSLHDALPIYQRESPPSALPSSRPPPRQASGSLSASPNSCRSEEHTSELQSQSNLVCRLLLEKKKVTNNYQYVVAIYLLSVNLDHRAMHVHCN